MEFKKLDKKAKIYWVTINLLIALLLLTVALIIVLTAENEFLLPILLSVGLPALIISLLIIIYPFLKYRYE